MSLLVTSIVPKFGENYDVGYIGFTYVSDSAISKGIAYFERWERLSDIPVSHVFVVTGNDCLVEAAWPSVRRASISRYFAGAPTRVFFRQPRNWSPRMGHRIAKAAESKIGAPYDSGLIIADAAADTFLGHWLNVVFNQWPKRLVNWYLDQPKEYICSELAAYALDKQPELHGRGCLGFALNCIDPQELFQDESIFEDWVRASGHGPELNKVEGVQ